MEAERNAEEHYFPPGRSMARRVHGERSVGLLYGQRALLIGALEPLTYTGTMLSTRSGDRPFERLARTAKIQETVFLGTREEADEALAKVHRLHETIKGELPEAAGAHPAGTPYSAFDPELMLWTLAVIADSGREMYETLVRPLDPDERERLWQDYVRFGELFGLPRSEVPGSHASSRPGSTASSPRPTCRRPSTGWRWRRWWPSASRCRRRRAATSPSRTTSSRGRCRRACARSSASAGAAPTRRASGRSPPPTAAPAALFPHRMRRGRNDVFFDVVTKAERRRGGTVTPQLRAGAS